MSQFDNCYIGLMSGTSMDAIDAVAIRFEPEGFSLLGHHSITLTPSIKNEILKLNSSAPQEIGQLGRLDRTIGKLFAQCANELVTRIGLLPNDISAIGSHGQTLRHQPEGKEPFTLQIGDPNTIAELTGITTVADFRRADIAAGGQGAPLVPAFHRAICPSSEEVQAIINIGGIANITVLPENSQQGVTGYDIGPGNILLDAWINSSLGQDFDEDGTWSRSGQINRELLDELIKDPYFNRPPPKSTGRDYFNLDWLQEKLTSYPSLNKQDVQRTLLELTAITIAQQIDIAAKSETEGTSRAYLCGGGVKNRFLVERITSLASACQVSSTSDLGIDPQQVEAAAFAWLAYRAMNRKPGNIPSVTGASKEKILGGIFYP